MALSKKVSRNGPVMGEKGGDPVNPSDVIQSRGVPIVYPPKIGKDGVTRRPFTLPTKSPLHRSEGPSVEDARNGQAGEYEQTH